ncbi:MAG: DNA repair protein RadC [Aquificota bacterium]|nr:DNA repair protein RadC [Aquificota bacterium]MDQ7082296.1 DNA repair protein RadC [Aquificota bacterium]
MRYRPRKLKDLPEDLRPREKLRNHGPKALSDEELLAVILGTGTKDRDVLKLSEDLLREGWEGLRKLSLEDLMRKKGLGEVKALQVKALLEIAERIKRPGGDLKILSPETAYMFLRKKLRSNRETLVALYLDLSHRVIGEEVVAVGSANRVLAQPKDILFRALELSAYGVLIAHNHPQGTHEPSKEDIDFTRRLKEACELLGFELVDHLIISEEGYTSLKEMGYL